jgi:hypothetical protein
MTKEPIMLKPCTGVCKQPESTWLQLRMKVPSELISQYPSEWVYRVSLDTADLREVNEKAAAIWADWLTKLDQQRQLLNTQRADSISSELAKVLAEQVTAQLLAADETVRTP